MGTKQTLILSAAIVLGFLLLGLVQRYELVATAGDPRILRLDKATGRVWVKFQSAGGGPSKEWLPVDEPSGRP
jgi:hypothetical protein